MLIIASTVKCNIAQLSVEYIKENTAIVTIWLLRYSQNGNDFAAIRLATANANQTVSPNCCCCRRTTGQEPAVLSTQFIRADLSVNRHVMTSLDLLLQSPTTVAMVTNGCIRGLHWAALHALCTTSTTERRTDTDSRRRKPAERASEFWRENCIKIWARSIWRISKTKTGRNRRKRRAVRPESGFGRSSGRVIYNIKAIKWPTFPTIRAYRRLVFVKRTKLGFSTSSRNVEYNFCLLYTSPSPRD